MSTREIIAGRRDVALVDLVDRLLAGGVVIGGDITLSIADVDLIHLRLQLLLGSASTLDERGVEVPRADQGQPT